MAVRSRTECFRIIQLVLALTAQLMAAPAAAKPLDLSEIRAATVVALDWTAFPTLPAYDTGRPTVVVATTGDDLRGIGSEVAPFRTIARALKAARPGAAILIHGGTYGEVVEPGDYRALVVATDDLVIAAAPGERVEIVPASPEVGYGMVIAGRGITVRGLRFAGFKRVGLLFDANPRGNAQIVLAGLKIDGSEEGIAVWEPAAAVEGLLVTDIELTGINGVGFHCGQGRCTNWHLDDVRIVMGGGPGNDTAADAFAIEDGDNILLARVRVSGANGDGIDLKATRTVIIASRVENVGRNGIKLWHGGDVINTLVHHTGADAALVVKGGTRFRLVNSLVAYHNFRRGRSYSLTVAYETQEAVRVEILNSMVVNVAGGFYVSPSSSLTISNCLFSGIETGRLLDFGERQIDLATAPSTLRALGFGTAVQIADPRLDGRFVPSAQGPAIDAGIVPPAPYPYRDAEGRPRVLGAAPDLGPFEVR